MKRLKKFKSIALPGLSLVSSLLLFNQMSARDLHAAIKQAVTDIKPLRGSDVTGSLLLSKVKDGIVISGEIHGLAPNSIHGMHIHEKGNCAAPDGSSAGGHFNPAAKPHGDLNKAKSHSGDLGNIVADDNGVAHIDIRRKDISLSEGTNDVMGRSIIVHAKKDDLKTQPAGDSGDRVACGVIAEKDAKPVGVQ